MSCSGDLAEAGRAFTLHRDIPADLPAAAARYVLSRATDPEDAAYLLDVLGLTEAVERTEVPA